MSNQKRKTYDLSQSPFFGLSSKKRLADLLGLSQSEFKELIKSEEPERYRIQPIVKKGIPLLRKDGSPRMAEVAVGMLRPVHDRIFRLLTRIALPDYLHSGVKKRSYLSNARAHVDARVTIHLDLKQFYPSTRFHHVKTAWASVFNCSSDVSYVLALLCTFNNHIPTGSSISGALAFYSHKQLFDAFGEEALVLGLVMTIYGDDFAVSGSQGVDAFSQRLKTSLRKQGLDYRELARYGPNQCRDMTGSIIAPDGLRLPNRRYQAIMTCFKNWESSNDEVTKESFHAELKGRLNEASQYDASIVSKFANRMSQAGSARLHS
jgi:hypothetical protein